MKQSDFIKQAIEIIKSTDADGFPLASHTKIARLRILLEKYENEQKIIKGGNNETEFIQHNY